MLVIVGLQGVFTEIEGKASGQDENDQTLVIAPPFQCNAPPPPGATCPLTGKVCGPLLTLPP